jgi:hypothetical protein
VDATVFFRSLGTLLQLGGVATVAYGVMQLREQLDPERSLLRRLRLRSRRCWQALRIARSRTWRWLRRSAGALWAAMTGRPRREYRTVNLAGRSLGSSISLGEPTITQRPAWDALDIDAKVEDLNQRVTRLRKHTTAVDERQRRDRERVERELAETRRQLEDLHLGGLTVEAWGGGLVAVGIVVAGWPDWFATSVAVRRVSSERCCCPSACT